MGGSEAVARLRIHDLRHAASLWVIADGADVFAVQRMAGYKSARTILEVYGHVFDEGLDTVAGAMDRRLSGVK